ncbi:amino acid ABC transporter permease [Rhodococcus koreensis]
MTKSTKTPEVAFDVSNSTPPRQEHELQVARKLHPTWWVATAIIAVIVAMFVRMLVTNENLQWDVVSEYFFSERILSGLVKTLELTAISMILAVALGSVLAVMRLSKMPIISSVSWVYIWFFRGTPLLVQIIFWFNLSFLTPRLSVGIPFGPEFMGAETNQLISPYSAAIIALSLCEAAYMAEIIRGGLQSIAEGQGEAAHSLGLNKLQTMRYIVFPQAMRVIVPPTGNQTIGMLKTSAMVSVIALPELLYSAQLIYARTYQVIPLLVVATLWYVIVSTILTIGQYYVERHYASGSSRSLPPTPIQKAKRTLARLTRPAPTGAPAIRGASS